MHEDGCFLNRAYFKVKAASISLKKFRLTRLPQYDTQNLLITVPQAITYFVDAEESEDPVSLKNQNWKGVQQFINKKVSEYLR